MMKVDSSDGTCTPLPLSALRLLVPPVRLVSAVVWQTVKQKVVADYGMLEEFVSMITDIVPELLTSRQKAQLILGLRARLILELCQFEATADIELVQPHLDRVQVLTGKWIREVGAADMEVPHSEFVDLVKNLIKNPDEKEHFFQNVFPEEFGPAYDEALHTLMWFFLSRLEQFLPFQTFQQVASVFGEVSSVLQECMDSICQREELKTLLQNHIDLNHLDYNDGSLDGACILSALKFPSIERTETDKTQPQADIMKNVPSCPSHLENESLTVPHTVQVKEDTITPDHRSEIKADETYETVVLLGDTTGNKGNVDSIQSDMEDGSHRLKQCSVQLKRLDMQLSLQTRPVRRNRGLRMKEILLEEARSLHEGALPACKSASCKTKPSNRALSETSDNDSSCSMEDSYMAPIKDCSEDDSWSYYSDENNSWSYYSDENSCQKSLSTADSWSIYSDDGSFVTPVRSSSDEDSLSHCSNEDPSFILQPKNVSSATRKQGKSDIKATTSKKTRKAECFICKEHVYTGLRAHMQIHFPGGDYACPRCSSRFKLLSSLKLHLNRTCYEYGQQQVDPDKAKHLNKCDKCEETFRYKVSLERHKLTHNKLYCNVCRKVLKDTATVARHKASHTLFQCNRCEETFIFFKPLLRHYQNIHKIIKPFTCNYCPKIYSKLRILIAHEWKHTGHLPFQCAQCDLRFKTDADLISHERVHTREKPYLCAECGKTFAQKSNLLRHLNFIHSELRNEKKHTCSECDRTFKEKGALKRHQRSKHLKELFRHPCPYCGKMVASSTIARHKLIHTGERPFKCIVPECDKHFRSTSEVKRHVLIHHSSERPYKCDICGKGFIKMCFLKAHAKIHSGEKPFVCDICCKAFPKLYSMKRHKKIVHSFVTQ